MQGTKQIHSASKAVGERVPLSHAETAHSTPQVLHGSLQPPTLMAQGPNAGKHIKGTAVQNTRPAGLPSERRFGFTLAAGLAIMGIRGTIAHWSWKVRGTFFVVSIVCAFLAYLWPRALAPFNRTLFYLGQQLGKILTPAFLGIIFFAILTPIAVVTRLFGRDELRLKRRAVNSYWIDRDPSAPEAHSFKNQF